MSRNVRSLFLTTPNIFIKNKSDLAKQWPPVLVYARVSRVLDWKAFGHILPIQIGFPRLSALGRRRDMIWCCCVHSGRAIPSSLIPLPSDPFGVHHTKHSATAAHPR